ncbi:MAG: hypothetical protein KGY81_07145, partial [Phycisphaerae bacterium]|nr:hypothetical protein [Phycisphaerae bacterium]
MASVTTFGNKGCHDAIRQAIASKDFAAARELALAARQQGDTSGLVLATLGELAMHMDGDFEQGAAYLREACQQPKRTTTMLMNLGICLMELCRIDEAIEPLMAAYRMQPDTDGLVGRLMTALEWCGRWGEMTTILQKFVDEKPDPSAIDWLELAQTYDRANQASEARGAFYRSVEIEETEQNCDLLANFLQQRGEIAEAFKWSEKACALSDSCQTQINHAYILMGAGRTEEALDEMRQVVARDTPGAGRARHSSVLFFEHYGQSFTREDCYRSAVAWAEKHIDASSIRTDHQRDLSANRRLRIGYVSADFRTHSVTYFMESVLDGCNPKAVENIAYSVGESQDATTERLSRKFHEFRYMGSHDVSRFAQQVEDDQIDILVDLGGHTTNNRQAVFGVKPAPIQVTWCGHPDTVGNPAIDYRIVDALTDPPDTETWHTEELAYMPDSFLCYRPPVHAPAIGPPPRTTNGHVTFGSFNNLMKVTPLVRGLWAQVLAAVPDSRLILKIRGGEEAIVHERLLDDFARVGVDRERVIIRGMVGNATDHLACYNEVDIALDSYPYNGTTTTCEALWMGVPVLTLCGDVHCSRVGYSLLSNCDMEFFVAHDPEEYVRKAIALAGNTEASETIRKTMRQRLAASPLCNAPRFAHHLELLYRSMWHRWCEGQGVEIPEQAPAELTTSHEDRLAASARRRLGNKGTRPTIRVLHNMARTGGTLLG